MSRDDLYKLVAKEAVDQFEKYANERIYQLKYRLVDLANMPELYGMNNEQKQQLEEQVDIIKEIIQLSEEIVASAREKVDGFMSLTQFLDIISQKKV